MTFIKYLKYDTYLYDNDHDKQFAEFDAKITAVICGFLTLVMGGILVLILVRPDLRYDSGMDNLPKLVISVALGMLGLILSVIPIKSLSVRTKLRKAMRYYLSFIFLMLSGYEFIMSDAKADGIFVYLMYCMSAIVLLHIHPLIYTAQTVIVLLLTTTTVYQYFDSLGTMFSYFCLLIGTVILVFYSNYNVHKKLEMTAMAEYKKQLLEQELEIKRTEIFDSIQKQVLMQENIIVAIADLVENRDMDTGTHIKATSFYAKLIADDILSQNLYSDIMTPKFAYLVEKAAPMHDLGKIAIPDDILKAPRRLTDDEFEIMKQHTVEGYKIIHHIYENIETPEYIECAANIAKYHHERWDGKGYPEGLSGANIPLEARIMAVADVFDALVSRRCYKDAYPLSEAFAEIERGAGTQFDPVLVNIFIGYKDKIKTVILDEFEDV